MQAINRIQNATINATACTQGATVVDGANAHRAYPSFVPCDMNPVSKCPPKWSSYSSVKPVGLSKRRLGLSLEGRGRFLRGPAGEMWRRDRQHMQMPATIWATFVLNRNCG